MNRGFEFEIKPVLYQKYNSFVLLLCETAALLFLLLFVLADPLQYGAKVNSFVLAHSGLDSPEAMQCDQHVTDNNDTVAEMTEIGILFGSENKSSCLDLSARKEFDDDVFPTCAVLLKAEEVVGKPELNPIILEVEGVVEKPSLHPVPSRPIKFWRSLNCVQEELQSAKHSEVAAVCNVIKHKGKKDAAKSKKKNVELPVGDQQNGSANEIMASTHC
uniref:Uncharacterized protein n=1 Tax=Ditylenchus dipsaci TaxID=166011 RepID=A0A915ESP2_9BILA